MPELRDGDIADELSELEGFIDESDLRGAPLAALKEFAGLLRSNQQTRQDLERICRECEAAELSDSLSPELYFLLFGRKKKEKTSYPQMNADGRSALRGGLETRLGSR